METVRYYKMTSRIRLHRVFTKDGRLRSTQVFIVSDFCCDMHGCLELFTITKGNKIECFRLVRVNIMIIIF